MSSLVRFLSTRPRAPKPHLVTLLVLVPLILAVAACEDTPAPVVPSLSSIEVTTTTHGDGPAPDSFTVMFNGGPSGKIGQNDQFTIGNIPKGTHQVALEGFPENCYPVPSPRLLTVEPDKITYTTFLVRCRLDSQE